MLIRSLLLTMCVLLPVAAEAETLRIALDALPKSQDPHRMNAQISFNLSAHIYEGLYRRQPDLSPVPVLVTGSEHDGGLNWKFSLRGGVEFHDGSGFDGSDVVYTFCRIQQIGNVAFSGVLSVIDRIVADDTSLQVHTVNDYPMLPNVLTTVLIAAAPMDWPGRKFPEDCAQIDAAGNAAHSGTGPYVMQDMEAGVSVSLKRNERYWGTAPEWDSVVMTVEPNAGVRSRMVVRGEADIANGISLDALTSFYTMPNLNVVVGPIARTIAILFAFRDEPSTAMTRDIRFRKALYHGINRTVLSQEILLGISAPAGQIMPEGMVGHNSQLPSDPYDPKLAMAYLQEAGYGNGADLEVSVQPSDLALVTALSSQLEKIGVRLRAKPFSDVPDQNLIGVTSFIGGLTPLTGELSYLASGVLGTKDHLPSMGAENYTGYSNPIIDGILTELRTTQTASRKLELLDRLSAEIVNDLPVLPILHMGRAWVTRSALTFKGRADGLTLAQDVHNRSKEGVR